MSTKYYSPNRPLTPGTFPNRKGLEVIEVRNFDSPLPIKGASRPVWGWVEYEGSLTPEEIEQYELLGPKERESTRLAKKRRRLRNKQINVEFNLEEPREAAVVEYILSQPNKKDYIMALVEADMANN